MKAHITLNIADVDEAVREYVARKAPGIELEGYTVKSWNQEVFNVYGEYLDNPHHVIRADHKELK